MNLPIYTICFLILSNFFIYLFYKKTNFFNSYNQDIHQKFASKNLIKPVGGTYILLSFYIINFDTIGLSFLFYFLIFLIGIFADLKKLNSPKLRFFIQTFIIISFVIFSNIEIESSRVEFFDKLLKFNYFNIFFTFFCLITVVNGTNFIDGLNGNVLGYFISVILCLIFVNLNFDIISISNLSYLLIIFIVLFFFNLMNNIYLGDNGAYLIGLIFGVLLINIHQTNELISPYYIILLLWYPCFENLFSIIRKYIFRKSPIEPDNEHLHQIIYSFLFVNFFKKKQLLANNFSSLVITAYNFVVLVFGSFYPNETKIQLILIIFNILVYLSTYVYLKKINLRYL